MKNIIVSILFLFLFSLASPFTLSKAARVKKNPQKAVIYTGQDSEWTE